MLLPLCLLPFSSLLYILYKRACSQASVYKLSCRIISFSDWPQVRECGFWNPESMKFCLWNPKSWALESVVQLNESGIPITIGNRIPSTTEKVGEGGHPDLEMEGGGGGAVSKNFFSALQASAPSLDPPLLITTAQLTRNYRSPGHSDLLHFTTCVSTPYALTLPPHALRFPEL